MLLSYVIPSGWRRDIDRGHRTGTGKSSMVTIRRGTYWTLSYLRDKISPKRCAVSEQLFLGAVRPVGQGLADDERRESCTREWEERLI